MSDLIRKAQDVMEEAAVEIERLDAENAKLRAELAEKDAAIAQAYEDGRISACNAGKPGCPRAAASEAELAAVRALMDTYNVGGWTDAIEPMKRALAAEAECARLREALAAIAAECTTYLARYGADCNHLIEQYQAGFHSANGTVAAAARIAVAALGIDMKPKEPKP